MLDANIIDLFHHNSVKPSIDKVTLCGVAKRDILYDDFESLVAENGENQYLYEEYTSSRFMSFARLIKIAYKHDYPNGTSEVFTVAIKIGWFGMNMCGTTQEQRTFQIEFNPNKFVFPYWLSKFLMLHDYVVESVKNIDLAFDFVGFRKSDFRYVLNNGNVQTASIGTIHNRTDYIGFADKSKNRIKIYDKKKERAKYYKMVLETARVEITLEYQHKFWDNIVSHDSAKLLDSACNSLEQIYIADSIASDPFVYALSCLSPDQFATAVSLMTAPTRRKYKKLCKQQGGFKIHCCFVDIVFFLNDELEKILHDNLIRCTQSMNFKLEVYSQYAN